MCKGLEARTFREVMAAKFSLSGGWQLKEGEGRIGHSRDEPREERRSKIRKIPP